MILIIFVSVGFLFAAPQPAKAQLATVDLPQKAWNIIKDVYARIKVSLVQAGTTALLNAAQSFTQKLAYDTAVYVASGGSGQKPLFDGKSFGAYIRDTALDSAMVFITNFSDGTLGKYGFNVCAPSLSLIGKIRFGALGSIPGGGALIKPKCDFNQFTKQWNQFGSSLGNGSVLKNFGVMFESGNSELDFAFEFNSKLVASTQNKLSQAIAERASTGGWQDVKNIVTGKVKTPADWVNEFNKAANLSTPQQQQQLIGQAAILTLKEGAWAILPTTLSTFTNTLLSQAMKRVMTGIFPGELFSDQNNPGNPNNANSPVGLAIGRRVAEQVYSDLIKPKILTASNYDPLSDFTACPDKEGDKQINNCVMDDGFASAVRQADTGKPLSVAEAIAAGYLDGGKMLIDSKEGDNEQKNCYQNAYCYSNLVKLRKARVLPVGWELAADLNVQSPRATLNEIVKGFNNCNPATNARDTAHPWCHLIDPNWVLRLPKTQCNATVYGPTLASAEGGFRTQICADPVSCLSQDENGNCTGGYGYCTKEKNIWRIAADTCSEQFNTCLTYNSRDGKPVNYLKNTVDFDSCSSLNVGCRPYSVNQKISAWSLAPGDAVYLNKNAEKCEAQNAGCTELYQKKNGLAYNLLPNPSFEKAGAAANTVANWAGGPDLKISADGTQAFDGKAAAVPGENVYLHLTSPLAIKLEYNTAYAFSAYVKSGLAADYQLEMGLYTDPLLGNQFNAANLISTCQLDGAYFVIKGNATVAYTRVSCAFLTPSVTLYARPLLGGSAWVDAVQLEEGAAATPFLSSGYGAVTSVFAKVPPSFLDCPAGSTDPRCANYAPTCKAEEVGCERYTPKNGNPPVSGVPTVSDICPAACNGYETYRQEKTLYETEKFPLYFIPTTARTCNSADVGCDEFTNLATEAKEYFSFIRQCIKLDPKDQWDTFYTWEGSDTTGYQLRAHRLKLGTPQPGETAPVPAVTDNNYAACTQTIFKLPITDPNYNPDCREFYNTAGQVSYRLLSKTIIATDDCTDYRKTDSNLDDCRASGGDWNPTAQYCLYHGYKAQSRICAAPANSCRAYSGAAATNLRIVFQDDFESGDDGWSGGAISSESLNAGGHSYKAGAGAGITKNLTGRISPLQSYSLSFWAKGNGGENLQIAMSDALHGSVVQPNGQVGAPFFTVTLKGDWQYYQLGPIHTNPRISAAPSLQIKLTTGAGFYIDNIVLTEAAEKLYLIKNSWTTPAVCDKTSQGVLLPQAMLGCKEYATRAGASVYLKSFSSLCRDEAVGCSAFQDTQNTAKDFSEFYNLICSLPNIAGGDCQYNGATVCSIGVGSSLCRFNVTDGSLADADYLTIPVYKQSDYPIYTDANGKIYRAFDAFQAKLRTVSSAGGTVFRDESTVETAADKTIYAVDDKKYYCQQKDAGCSALGQPDLYKTTGAATVYFKNAPDNYSQILCAAEAQGCESWTSAKGVDYFKVPKGQCEYRPAAGGNTGGWYQSGTDTACYPGLIQNGVNGIWRNADTAFTGLAGLCPDTQNECTEFVDPWDTSGAAKKGHPYYLIDNEKLKTLENDPSCTGKSSLESGCVLFNKTSDINLKWNAFVTYEEATKEKKPVTPIKTACGISPAVPFFGLMLTFDPFKSCVVDSDCPSAGTPVFSSTYTGTCVQVPPDSNIILKVTRDRECGQWLSCKSSYTATDPLTQKTRPVCAELGLCDKSIVSENGASSCADFLATNPDSGNPLAADYYSKRNTTWAGGDYSGFSVGNQEPVTDVSFNDTAPGLMFGSEPVTANTVGSHALYTFDLKGNEINANQGEPTACRGYPEQDSPFPASVAQYDINGRLVSVNGGFQNANLCEKGKNCECDYTKLTYGGGATKKYTEYGNRNVPAGICQGGLRDGLPCVPGATFENDPKNSCGKPEEGGTCLKLERQDDVIGLSGYCLERDLSTPINGDKNQKACLTWLPQDIAPGQRDIYNQFRTAGYVPPLGGGKYYCLQSSGNYSDLPKTIDRPSGYDDLILTEGEKTAPGSTGQDQWTWGCNGICGIMGGNTIANIVVANGVTYEGFTDLFTNTIHNDTFYKTYNADQTVTTNHKQTDYASNSWSFYTADQQGTGITFPLKYRYYFKNDPINNPNGMQAILTSDLSTTEQIYKDDLDLIRIKFVDDGINNSNAHPNWGAVFYIDPSKKDKSYTAGTLCGGNISDNCSGEEGVPGLKNDNQHARSIVTDNKWYFRYAWGDKTDPKIGTSDYTEEDLFSKPIRISVNNQENEYLKPVLCNYVGSDRLREFQLVFEFDATGLLKDIGVVACAGSTENNAKNSFRLQVFARMRETCDVVVDVAASKNTANTQLLWPNNPDNQTSATDKYNPSPGFAYHYNYEVQPFGSANQNVAPSNNRWYSYYTVGQHSFAGVPWACTGACGTPLKSDNDPTTIDFDPNIGPILNPDGTPANLSGVISHKNLTQGWGDTGLSHIFGQSFHSYIWDLDKKSQTFRYFSHDCANAADKNTTPGCFSLTGTIYPRPVIYSYNPSSPQKLFKSGDVVINNTIGQNINIKGSQYLAVMRFYAWAMSQHMPLKSISVDWGDGSVITTNDGMYKNHKPVCAKTNEEKPNTCKSGFPGEQIDYEIICHSNPDCPNNPTGTGTCQASFTPLFGNSPDACEENYFEFQHTYTCGNAPGQLCSYGSPTVTVTDNWGGTANAPYGGKITLKP